MTKSRFFYFLCLVAVVLLSGCATADLRPDLIMEHGISDATINKAKSIISDVLVEHDPQNRWKDLTQWNIVGVDSWHVMALRYLSPVPNESQKFELILKMPQDNFVYTFLEGSKAGDQIGMESDSVYRVVQGVKYDTGVWKARLYLEPLSQAFLWPQMLTRMPVLVYGGQGELNDNFYYRIYAAQSKNFSDPNQNQYILWVNQVTRQIDLIEYTLRDVLKSYQGTVHYSGYHQNGSVLVPSQLKFGGKPRDGIIHTVQLENQSLK